MSNMLTMPINNDFTVILNKEDRKAKAKAIGLITEKSGALFNCFIQASIQFFFKEGDHHINIVNDLLKIAHNAKGMNSTRLSKYLEQIVPHKLQGASGETPPKFGKKLEDGVYPSFDEMITFTSENPKWYRYSVKQDNEFNLHKEIEKLVKKMIKNDVALANASTDLQQTFAEQLSKKLAA